MFIGHYGVSLAAKRVDARLPLGWLFLAVQIPDILWAVLFLLGIEKARIIPAQTAVRAVDLYYIPYSHSLAASLLWAVAIYALFRLLPSRAAGLRKSTVALTMALTVLSHFVLDVVVESNLPLYDDAAKIGLGLGHNAVATYIVEGLILVGGLILYLRSTTATNLTGKYSMIVFVILMLAFNLVMFGPPPTDLRFVAVSSLGSFGVMAGVAFWLDRQRTASLPSRPSRSLSRKPRCSEQGDEEARHSTHPPEREPYDSNRKERMINTKPIQREDEAAIRQLVQDMQDAQNTQDSDLFASAFTGGSLPSWRATTGDSSGRFEGAPYGSDVSFFVVDAAPGDGPALHRHPYSETFVVQSGRARFEVGGRPVEAVAGDVLVAAPGTAHAFRALGPERLQMVAIHAAPRMETTWLEEGSTA
jgi:quercetin dioxygenase-like cupin family protein